MSRTDLDRHDVIWGNTNYRVFDSSGSLILNSDSAREINRLDEFRAGTTSPNFRFKRTRLGGGYEGLPMNPFTYSKVSHSYPTGSVSREISGFHNVWQGITQQPFPFNFPSEFDSVETLDARAHNKMLRNLKDQRVNILQVLGERKQSATLIYEAADRLAQAIRSARNGNIVQAAKLLRVPWQRGSRKRSSTSRQLADDWLALKFGWDPLINDIKGAAEVLARSKDQEPRFKVSASDSSSYSRVEDLSESWGPPTRLRQWGNRTVKYVSYFTAENEVLSSLGSLGVTNVPSALYQLTPWSFVVDYFVRVGEFLDLLDAGNGMKFEKGCRTLFEREQMRYECSGTRIGGDGSVYTGFSKASSIRIYCQRTITSGFGLPSITLGSGLTTTRTTNLGALLRQRIRR